jgi:hypothetical protein
VWRSAWLIAAHLLLLHELGVWAVIDDILAKHRSGEDGVNFLGIDIADLAVQDEFVASGADASSCFPAEEDEGIAVAELKAMLARATQGNLRQTIAAYLLAVFLEEIDWVDSVRDGAADPREPVKYHGRLVQVLEQQLLRDVDRHRQKDESHDRDSDLGADSQPRKLLGQRSRYIVKETHGIDSGGCGLGVKESIVRGIRKKTQRPVD